ncbi:MAG: transcription termination/antitermination protein NusA, partial [Desulfobacterales bacterium]|nr:transcription termination/antitermination protein NusA [Desulfobacterales bacterium]
NVRLASRLTGWHLDVISETRYNEGLQSGFQSMINLPGMDESLAKLLFGKGYFSVEDLSKATAEELAQEISISEQEARQLIKEAANYRETEKQAEDEDTEQSLSADEAGQAGDDEISNDTDSENQGD